MLIDGAVPVFFVHHKGTYYMHLRSSRLERPELNGATAGISQLRRCL